jgi:hypothetical protein
LGGGADPRFRRPGHAALVGPSAESLKAATKVQSARAD